ncbi:MAG: signal peptidase I [Clostridia bacterium]|nr:signal peptidase I [Clostridia bacterium]
MKKALKTTVNVIKYLFLGICILIIVANLYSLVARKMFSKQLPLFFGVGTAIVASGSMEPEIMTGEMVFVVAGREYEVGEIVSYTGKNTPITHRIIRINRDENGKILSYVTAGDNNLNQDGTLSEDGDIAPDRIIGRVVWHNKALGDMVVFMQSPLGMVALVVLGAAIYFVPEWISKRKNGEAPQQD